MSCPNILKFSTFLAHQHPQDAQVRPLHHACVAREEAQRPATQPVAHVGLSGWTHRGKGRAAGMAGPMRGAPLTLARGSGCYFGPLRPQLSTGTRKNLTRKSQTGHTAVGVGKTEPAPPEHREEGKQRYPLSGLPSKHAQPLDPTVGSAPAL